MTEIKSLIKQSIEKSEVDNLELYFSSRSQTTIKAFQKEIAGYEITESSGLSARVIRENKMGFSFTEKVDTKNIEKCIQSAHENANYLDADKGFKLNENPEELHSVRFKSTETAKITAEMKKEFTLNIEKYAYSLDSRIINIPSTVYTDIKVNTIIANSFNVFKSDEADLCYAYTSVMAKENDDTQTGFYAQTARNFTELDYKLIAQKAVESAIEKLNAKEINSGSFPVILNNSTASALLAAFVTGSQSPFCGENIEKDKSKLKGKLNTKIANDLVTIIDDPLMFGMNSREFDAEGIPSKKLKLIDNGIFKTEIHNLYSATRVGKESTGHGDRSYTSGISANLSNPYLENGIKSETELINQIQNGVYLNSLDGLNAGINQISGDFSVSAKGFKIENGKKAYPIKNITVAGNFYNLINDIEDKANNRRKDSEANLSSPSIKIKKLSISGK